MRDTVGSSDSNPSSRPSVPIISPASIKWRAIYIRRRSTIFDPSEIVLQQSVRGSEIVLIGHATKVGETSDLYFGRYTEDGLVIAETIAPLPMDDYVIEVRALSEGGYIAAGASDANAALFRLTENGSLLWRKTFSLGGRFESVDQASNGGFVATGTSDRAPAVNTDAFVLRLDSNGDSLWIRMYGTSERESGQIIRTTSDGGLLLIGMEAGIGDVIITFLTTEGGFISRRVDRTINIDEVRSLERDGSGYLIGGTAYNSFVIGGLTEGGMFTWTKQIASNGAVMKSIDRTSDGGLILVGSTQQPPNIHAQRLTSEVPSSVQTDELIPLHLDLQ